jgi:membrane protein required for colicin V production
VNATDFVLLLILGVAGFRGYQRGFVVSLLSIVAFWVALVLAFMFLDWGVQFLDQLIDGFTGILPYLAFILIFASVAVGINILGKVLKKTLDLTLLGKFDNLAGGILAVLTWAFGISVVVWLSHNVGMEVPDGWAKGSIIYQKIEPVAPAVIDVFSEYMPFIKHLFKSIADRLSPAVP